MPLLLEFRPPIACPVCVPRLRPRKVRALSDERLQHQRLPASPATNKTPIARIPQHHAPVPASHIRRSEISSHPLPLPSFFHLLHQEKISLQDETPPIGVSYHASHHFSSGPVSPTALPSHSTRLPDIARLISSGNHSTIPHHH